MLREHPWYVLTLTIWLAFNLALLLTFALAFAIDELWAFVRGPRYATQT